MVYPEAVEIFAHLPQAGLPPGITVLGHLFPVICREAPVLAVCRECIRRCAGLRIQVEEIRELPGVHTGAADSDRQVSLYRDSLRMGIFHRILELGVEAVLFPAAEVDLLTMLLAECLDPGLGIYRMGLPLAEFRSSVHVAKHAEGSIRHEPVLVRSIELLVWSACHHLGSDTGESFLQEAFLLVVDPFVVDLRKGVQFIPEGLVFPGDLDPCLRK